GSELTLKAAGSFIRIDGGGVTLSGPVININSGGSPGNGTGAIPLLPGPLKQADADKAGKLLIPAQRQALLQKKPLCAICEAAKAEARNA
ncbi:type VI secretion system tip protein VgrG, partial [Pseudomonas daroniae]